MSFTETEFGAEEFDPLSLTCEEFFEQIMAKGVAVPVGEIIGPESTRHIELLEKQLANAGLLGRVTIVVTADELDPEALIANFRLRSD